MTLVEQVARAMWEQRRKHAKATLPDLPDLEEWGDGGVPKANGIMEEARAGLAEIRTVIRDDLGNPDKHSMTLTEHDAWRDVIERIDGALKEAT